METRSWCESDTARTNIAKIAPAFCDGCFEARASHDVAQNSDFRNMMFGGGLIYGDAMSNNERAR